MSFQSSNAGCTLALNPDGVATSLRRSLSYDSSSRLPLGVDSSALNRHLTIATTPVTRTSRTKRQAHRGFTLIEVLVALAIVAVTLGAGIKAAGALSQNTERVALISMAQWCAENELVAIRLSREFPGIGDATFSCEQLGITFKGRRLVRPTPNPNFRRVDAEVLDTNERPLLTLSTVVPRFY